MVSNENVNIWYYIISNCLVKCTLKGAVSGLWQFFADKSPLKVMKNAFYFTPKALLVLKIFKILPWLFGHVAKRLDKKDKFNFKFYDVTAWLSNNGNTYIAQYLEKERKSDNETWSVNRMQHEERFSSKVILKMWWINYSQTLFWKIKI